MNASVLATQRHSDAFGLETLLSGGGLIGRRRTTGPGGLFRLGRVVELGSFKLKHPPGLENLLSLCELLELSDPLQPEEPRVS